MNVVVVVGTVDLWKSLSPPRHRRRCHPCPTAPYAVAVPEANRKAAKTSHMEGVVISALLANVYASTVGCQSLERTSGHRSTKQTANEIKLFNLHYLMLVERASLYGSVSRKTVTL